MRTEGLLDTFFRKKDDFTFYQENACYSWYEYDMDNMDDMEFREKWEEKPSIEVYHPGDPMEPDYVRRFEDYNPSKIYNFVTHVLQNIKRQDGGFDEYAETNPILRYTVSDDDGEYYMESEVQTEQLTTTDNAGQCTLSEIRDSLAYCLYRMNKLSCKLGINVLSMVFAQLRSKLHNTTYMDSKPGFLVMYGTYYANPEGDCSNPVTYPQDKSLTSARRLLAGSSDVDIAEFNVDYQKLLDLIRTLNINVDVEDPRVYTKSFIDKISKGILVNNYTYVARKHGGYNMDVLNKLKDLTLDSSTKVRTEERFDVVEHSLDIILDYEKTPSNVYRAFTRRQPKSNFDFSYRLILEVQKSESHRFRSDTPSYKVDDNGFLLDVNGDYVSVYSMDIVDAEDTHCTTGVAYFHTAGFVMFGAVGNRVLVCELDDYLRSIQLGWKCRSFYKLGEEE